jgi:hypothetical protein
LEDERKALGGQVFDVLGKILFDHRPLRDLMIEAIRYGDRQDVRQRLTQVVVNALDHQHLQALLDQRALAHEVMDVVRVRHIRAEMERALARRLQPHFIGSFFLEALKHLNGRWIEREPRRYEIKHIPQMLRNHVTRIGKRAVIQHNYERVVFEKELVHHAHKPRASLICPGHPLLDATIDLVLEQYRDLLKQSTILVNPQDMGEELKVIFYLEHTIQDASTDASGQRHEVSRQLQFIELDAHGTMQTAGYAPFLDYRALYPEEMALIPQLKAHLKFTGNLEEQAKSYAITQLVPQHLVEVRQRCEVQINKTRDAVNERLTKEISYWDSRAAYLKEQEAAGKVNAHLNSHKAEQRARELYSRLLQRMQELEQGRHLSPLPPVVVGGVLVAPQGLINRLNNKADVSPSLHAHETAEIERRAMQAVMQREQQLGFEPRDVSAAKCGYDIESRIPTTGKLRFIEVKGRIQGARDVIVTKNEILTALNRPDDFILAIVFVDGEQTTIHYILKPFQKEPDFAATSVNYDLSKLLHKGAPPIL